jgi:hypothetical protein
MTVPPTPSVIEIGINAAGGAARNSATQAAMSIDVAAMRSARLRIIEQRCCRVPRSTASIICMQIAVCAGSPSEPEYKPSTRHRHYPHSA